MSKIAVFLLFALMLGVMVALCMGLAAMVKGGGLDNAKKSNKLMQWRIYLQAGALAVFAIVLVLAKQ